MSAEDREDRRLEAALRLTDALERAEAPDGTPADSTPGLGVLSEIGRAFRGGREAASAEEGAAMFFWGPLEVRRRLGHGSFGEVFAAWEPRLQRQVALKLRRAQAGTLRWLDEARGLARVRHPNVVIVFGADLRDGRAGMWTELVEGETLEEVLAARGPMAPEEALRIARDLASALDAVHRAGLVHGDLKASNVMLERPAEGAAGAAARVVLMDFGSASSSDAGDERAARFATPAYAAPEVLSGHAPTPAADVYALGVLLYRLLTGAYPLEGGSAEDLRARHTRGERVPIARRRKNLSRDVVRIVDRALAPVPEHRYADAASMRHALARALGERTPGFGARTLLAALAVIVALAAVAAAGWALYMKRESRDTEHYVVPPPATLAMSRRPWWDSAPDSSTGLRGWHARIARDLTGDGWPDVVVVDQNYAAAPGCFGRVMVYAGGPHGVSRRPAWTYLHPGSTTTLQDCAVGDFNGDGRPDLVVTWHLDPRPDGRFGGAIVFAGTPAGLGQAPMSQLSGEVGYTAFGECAAAGDVTGDGIDDLLLGEHDWSATRRNQGRVALFVGSRDGLPARPTQILTGEAGSNRFGSAIAIVGDVDGDGVADVAIGSPEWSGRHGQTGCVQLFLGGPQGLTPASCPRIEGRGADELVGLLGTVTGAGDVNHDGHADVVVSAPGHDAMGSSVGELRLYLGGPHGWTSAPAWHVEGRGSEHLLGWSVEVGDVDGDGLPDIVAGAHGFGLSPATKHAGAVFVFRGAGPRRYFERAPAWWVWSGAADLGMGSVLSVGDVDRDGLADILVQVPFWRRGNLFTGREVIFRGAPARAGL